MTVSELIEQLKNYPGDMGYYLCAVVGNNKPTELYWDGRFWGINATG